MQMNKLLHKEKVMIQIDEIKHLEELSNLQLTEEERETFAKEFESMVAFASQISQENVNNQGFIQTMDMSQLREDVAKTSLPQEQVVLNAPEKRKGCFVVPRIVE